MAINNHHTVEEINGIRCSVIEKNISPERANFISEILTSSGLKVEKGTTPEGTIILGVTDVTLNIEHALYARMLKNSKGQLITPAIWNNKVQTTEFYWQY